MVKPEKMASSLKRCGPRHWKKFKLVLVGPLKLQEVPDNFPLSRRFGVKQGEKQKLFSESPFSHSGTVERNDALSECPGSSSALEVDGVPVTEIHSSPRPQLTVSNEQWQLEVAANFGQFAQQSTSLLCLSRSEVSANMCKGTT